MGSGTSSIHANSKSSSDLISEQLTRLRPRDCFIWHISLPACLVSFLLIYFEMISNIIKVVHCTQHRHVTGINQVGVSETIVDVISQSEPRMFMLVIACCCCLHGVWMYAMCSCDDEYVALIASKSISLLLPWLFQSFKVCIDLCDCIIILFGAAVFTPEHQPDMLSNVVLVGGNACIPGYQQRM